MLKNVLSTFLIVLCVTGCGEVVGAPPMPAQPSKLSIRQICSRFPRPDWCREFYMDLALARSAREEVIADCATDRDCSETHGYQEEMDVY
jgi:hypothetical protein